LMELQPKRFFDILFQCGAFEILFSDIQLTDRDYTALAYAVKQQSIAEVRWAALLAHQPLAVIKVLLQRYRIPRVFSDVVLMISNEREAFNNICKSDPVSLLSFIKSVDVMRRPERFEIFYQACQAVHQDDLSQQQQHIKKAVTLLKEIDIAALNCQGLKGAEFAQALQQLQIQALATL
jgi:tRNA nucleotidyltransferase (CCA-adding enzyme)